MLTAGVTAVTATAQERNEAKFRVSHTVFLHGGSDERTEVNNESNFQFTLVAYTASKKRDSPTNRSTVSFFVPNV
jgi:V8-like Glu-specific endopeptidase